MVGGYAEILEDKSSTMDDMEFEVLLDSANLNQLEKDFLRLRVEGLTMEEITEDLGDSAYKIRQNLQDKVAYIL